MLNMIPLHTIQSICHALDKSVRITLELLPKGHGHRGLFALLIRLSITVTAAA